MNSVTVKLFEPRVRVHVLIYKDASKRVLNLITSFGKNCGIGVEWTGEKLIFSGETLDQMDEFALAFYRKCEGWGHCTHNIRARMRHRFGHNGHGWPVDERARIEAQSAANAANQITAAFRSSK